MKHIDKNVNNGDKNNIKKVIPSQQQQQRRRRPPRPGGPEPASPSASLPPHRSRNHGEYLQPQDDDDEDDDDDEWYNDDDYTQPGATPVSGTRPGTSNYASFLVQEGVFDGSATSTRRSSPRTNQNHLAAAPTIEAEIVDPSVEEDRVRTELLQQLKATAPAATVVEDKEESCWSGQRWKILVPVFLIVIAATATITVLLTRDDDVSPDSLTTDTPSQIPSMMPTTSPQPTGFPSVIPSFVPTSFWNQVGESQIFRQSLEGLGESDVFGEDLALSANGEILAVGAASHDFEGIRNTGQVQVFQRTANDAAEWVQLGQSLGGDEVGDNFGISVALSRDGTVVAYGGNRSDPNGMEFAGRVKVFLLNQNGNGVPFWVPLGSPIDGPEAGYEYALSLSLSSDGRILAIGTAVGQADVFRFDGDEWIRHGRRLTAGVGKTYVSLSGDGTIFAEGSVDTGSGRVRVHKYNEEGDEWRLLGSAIFGYRSDDLLGRSVSLSEDGTIVAIGAPLYDRLLNDGSSVRESGQVRVFQYDENRNSWVPLGQVLQGDDVLDFFGFSISLSDNGRMLGVGATQQFADGNPPGYAIAYRLLEDNTTWIPLGDRQIGKFPDDDFGTAVWISGNGQLFAIGAPQYRTQGDSDRIHIGYARVLEIAAIQ